MSLIVPDSGLLIWMTLIFAIVFFILAKFGFPLITGMVDKRSDRINASIAKAREAEEKLSALAEQQAALIEQARLEQGRILREAAASRDSIIAQAKEQASQEAQKILDHAKVQIAAERESAIREIQASVASITVDVAEKLVRKDVSSDAGQMALIERYLEDMSHDTLN